MVSSIPEGLAHGAISSPGDDELQDVLLPGLGSASRSALAAYCGWAADGVVVGDFAAVDDLLHMDGTSAPPHANAYAREPSPVLGQGCRHILVVSNIAAVRAGVGDEPFSRKGFGHNPRSAVRCKPQQAVGIPLQGW